ncbi:MAG: D-alanyl-D-alanine carboxypeptidase family protein [Oscillospiraceae bacterium]
MKRFLTFLLSGALAAGLAINVSAAEVSAASAIVYEPVTGTVLYEKAPDEQMLIASTTKIMTALVVLENCALDETVEVKPEHAAVEGSSMYLKPGEEYTVEELLYGLMLASGNDAAAALADHTAGSMEAFAALMNEKCDELGLENTHFVNSHGLDAEGHYSSARDLALITAAAMENEIFCRIFSTKTYSTHGLSYVNHNKLLSTCEGCTGGKTGYTDAAGRILVSTAEREGMTLICVTISDPRDWEDHKALYDACFGAYRFLDLRPCGEMSVISGKRDSVGLVSETAGLLVEKAAETELRYYLPSFVFAPVRRGEEAGRVELYVDGVLEQSCALSYADTVVENKEQLLSTWERLGRAMGKTSAKGIYYTAY